MKWSKYTLIFHSEKYGYLLYNSLTNIFAEIDDATYHELEKIRQSPDSYDFTRDPALYLQLLRTKVLVEPGEEETLLNILKLKRCGSNFSETNLSLTIAPTLACNFNCSYCYQSQHKPIYMNETTEDKVVEFIRRFKTARFLSVTWYGGEPLLTFDTICRLTEKIQALDIPFRANMVTNGYLLNEPVVAQLENLKINSIQVTLDGPEEVHNKRRPLVSGGGTYQTILSNVERLLETWTGKLEIRVNVDKKNMQQYADLYSVLMQKFPEKHVVIYPGIVGDSQEGNPDIHCQFTKDDEAEFIIELYKNYGIDNLRYYPKNSFGCIATCRNGFVIGPEGEVYNCWYDLGNQDMVIGSVYEKKPWNMKLIANYMIGTNPFDDPVCRDCFYLPVCDGGCAHFRLLNKYYGGNFNTCVNFKHNLPEFLEIYYEQKQKQAKEHVIKTAKAEQPGTAEPVAQNVG